MAFSEELKLQVKRRAHFRCCLCHNLGVEVHHIIPQSDGGPDIEDNAAPLCPSCHETYGANPQKRKFIREARDFWQELCEDRLAADSAVLKEIAERIEQTPSKADLQSAMDKLASLISNEKDPETISIALPQLYWVLVLAALEPVVKVSATRMAEMAQAGFDYDAFMHLPPEELKALTSPTIARAMIIDVLVERGIMTPEALQVGTKAIHRMADEAISKSNSG